MAYGIHRNACINVPFSVPQMDLNNTNKSWGKCLIFVVKWNEKKAFFCDSPLLNMTGFMKARSSQGCDLFQYIPTESLPKWFYYGRPHICIYCASRQYQSTFSLNIDWKISQCWHLQRLSAISSNKQDDVKELHQSNYVWKMPCRRPYGIRFFYLKRSFSLLLQMQPWKSTYPAIIDCWSCYGWSVCMVHVARTLEAMNGSIK